MLAIVDLSRPEVVAPEPVVELDIGLKLNRVEVVAIASAVEGHLDAFLNDIKGLEIRDLNPETPTRFWREAREKLARRCRGMLRQLLANLLWVSRQSLGVQVPDFRTLHNSLRAFITRRPCAV